MRGWAPGPVGDWEKGSKGWIVWISLAIMLADSIINLAWLAGRPLITRVCGYIKNCVGITKQKWKKINKRPVHEYAALVETREEATTPSPSLGGSRQQHPNTRGAIFRKRTQSGEHNELPEIDAPPEQLINRRTVMFGLTASLLFCMVTIRFVFGKLVPLYAITTAVIMALPLSVMGVRALGETDINPVSGISKLTQLFFAVIIPRLNSNSVIINLVAGAVSEAGALQAGDMLQDLKTGHILGASPKAQFYGQLIGSFVGAIASALVYRLYTSVYPVPGDLLQIPTGYVWIFTARLVTGQGLPPMAREWAIAAAIVFGFATVARIGGSSKWWQAFIPGGIAVAVGEFPLLAQGSDWTTSLNTAHRIGMYNIPSFTLARTIGGLTNWYWISHKQNDESVIIIVASGLILGEGVMSIVNLILTSFQVPHL